MKRVDQPTGADISDQFEKPREPREARAAQT
jgi:hypothetical protein